MSDRQRVLIIGGGGFIGSHLARALLELGHDVHIRDTHLHTHLAQEDGDRKAYTLAVYRERYDAIKASKGARELRFLDVNDSLDAAIKKGRYHYVIHLGDYSSQRMGAAYPEQIIRSTVQNAATIRDCVPYVQKRVIYFSSSMVYGNFKTFADEDQILTPMGFYGISRLAGEEIVSKSAGSVVIVRPSAVFGPWDMDDRVIGQFVKAAMTGRNLRVQNPGMILDFTPVQLVVNKVIALMYEHGLTRQVYNVTMSSEAKKSLSLLEAAQVICDYFGSKSEIKSYAQESGYPERGLLSSSLFYDDVGEVKHNPDLIQQLQETCAWRQDFYERTGF